MKDHFAALAMMLSAFAVSVTAVAAGEAGPSVVIGGSVDVLIDGRPASGVGDPTLGGDVVTSGESNVLINGHPAVTAGAATSCGGVVVGGSSSVFINGKPMATSGSSVSPCPPR